jgi:hypothetical protein
MWKPSQKGAGAPPGAVGQEAAVVDRLDAIKPAMTSWGEVGAPELEELWASLSPVREGGELGGDETQSS